MAGFQRIFRQTYALLRAHKFLWILGLFLSWSELFNALVFWVGNQSPSEIQNFLSKFSHFSLPGIILTVVSLISAFFLIRRFFRSKAAIIIATKAILDRQPTDFRKSFKASKKFYQRLIGVWLLIKLCFAVSFLILSAPVIYLISMDFTGRALALGSFALIIVTPLYIFSSLILSVAPLFVVVYDLKIKEAIAASIDLTKKFWLVFVIFFAALELLSALSSYLVSILGDFGLKIFHPAGSVEFLYVTFWAVLGFFGVIGSILVLAAVALFQQVAWVILFNELINPEKFEEEAAPLPQAVR